MNPFVYDMTLIMCVDPNNGYLFNERRQSRDQAVLRRILSMPFRVLKMEYRSYNMLDSYAHICRQKPRAKRMTMHPGAMLMSAEDAYFNEFQDPSDMLQAASRVILFRWDKTYPADRHLPDLKASPDWRLVSVETFKGFSHEEIQEETYEKV